jgi:hypothetical protein
MIMNKLKKTLIAGVLAAFIGTSAAAWFVTTSTA